MPNTTFYIWYSIEALPPTGLHSAEGGPHVKIHWINGIFYQNSLSVAKQGMNPRFGCETRDSEEDGLCVVVASPTYCTHGGFHSWGAALSKSFSFARLHYPVLQWVASIARDRHWQRLSASALNDGERLLSTLTRIAQMSRSKFESPNHCYSSWPCYSMRFVEIDILKQYQQFDGFILRTISGEAWQFVEPLVRRVSGETSGRVYWEALHHLHYYNTPIVVMSRFRYHHNTQWPLSQWVLLLLFY